MSRLVTFTAVLALSLTLATAQQPGAGAGGMPPGSASGTRTPGTGNPGTENPAAPGAVPGARMEGRGDSFISVAREETRITFISVAGRLEPARRLGHTTGVAGLVETVHVRVGERVAEGQKLLTIARDAPGESYRPVVIVSRIAGRVSQLATRGAELKAGAEAAVIIDDSEFRLVAALSDKDAFRVAAMPRAPLSARSADGVILKGSLTSVSAEPDYATGLFSAVLAFPAQAGARIGMVLFVDLPVDTLRGVFVNKNLIVRRFGRSLLWTIDAAGVLKQVPVTPGRPYGDDLILDSGLVPGTRYIRSLAGYEKEGMSLEDYREARKKAP